MYRPPCDGGRWLKNLTTLNLYDANIEIWEIHDVGEGDIERVGDVKHRYFAAVY
jgi:hypothetical protein